MLAVAVLVGTGLLFGVGFDPDVARVPAGVGLLVLFGFAFSWMFALTGLLVPSVEAATGIKFPQSSRPRSSRRRSCLMAVLAPLAVALWSPCRPGVGGERMASGPELRKSDFANIDGRVRCPGDECLGDLLLMPTGRTDRDGIPEFHPVTLCPLCGRDHAIVQDMTDRELFLRVSWLRANPGRGPERP